MAGLKPFRSIPTNLNEWTRWMRAQNIEPATSTSTSTSTSTTVVAPTLWTFSDFSGNYTLRSGDQKLFLRSTGGSATNVTVPAGVFEVGAQIPILQLGAGTVTIVAGSGVTIRTPSTLVFNEQYGTVTLFQMDNDEWFVAGRMAP